MTKAISKAARRRIRKREKPITLANGDTAPPIRGQGARKPAEDPRAVARAARQRRFAWHPSLGPINWDDPLAASPVGLCIMASKEPGLSATWHDLDAAHRDFRAKCLNTTGEPKCATAPVMPERMEAGETLRLDLRTADEKAKAARQRWLIWEARLARLPTPMHRQAIQAAMGGGLNPQAWQFWGASGLPTASGRLLIAALCKVSAISG
jgi:hypothetical protein